MRSFLTAALTVLALAPAASAQGVPNPYTGDPQPPAPGEQAQQRVGKAIAAQGLRELARASAPAEAAAAEPGSGEPGSARKPVQSPYDVKAKPRPEAQAAQEPEPPSGEPQPGGPDEPVDPVDPVDPEEPAGVGGTGTTGTLPRTGLEALWLALGGIALLFLGWRLHIVARVREVIRRLRTPKEALREELEGLLEAGAESERAYRANAEPPVSPATPGAERLNRR